MKKVIYVLLLVAVCALTISSCTEQQVKPSYSGGGVGSESKN